MEDRDVMYILEMAEKPLTLDEVVERINSKGSKFTVEEVHQALIRLHEECEINVETVYRV
jgi:hypothetical protein